MRNLLDFFISELSRQDIYSIYKKYAFLFIFRN